MNGQPEHGEASLVSISTTDRVELLLRVTSLHKALKGVSYAWEMCQEKLCKHFCHLAFPASVTQSTGPKENQLKVKREVFGKWLVSQLNGATATAVRSQSARSRLSFPRRRLTFPSRETPRLGSLAAIWTPPAARLIKKSPRQLTFPHWVGKQKNKKNKNTKAGLKCHTPISRKNV